MPTVGMKICLLCWRRCCGIEGLGCMSKYNFTYIIDLYSLYRFDFNKTHEEFIYFI